MPRYSLKALGWQKAKETRGTFYGPFYSSDEVLGLTAASDTETSSLYTLHSRAPSSPSESSFSPSSASNINTAANTNLKPVLKKKFHSRLHIGKMPKRDKGHRRTCSESVLCDERKTGNYPKQLHSPDTPSPKEIVLQFFGGAVGYHSPDSSKEIRHITFNSNDEEWVFDSKSHQSQDLCIAACVDERFRSLQQLINEEFELKKKLEAAQNINTHPPRDYLVDQDDDDDTNTATPLDLVSMAHNPSPQGDLASSLQDTTDTDNYSSSSVEDLIIPLRRKKKTGEFGERNCAFIEHMMLDKAYMSDSEFLDYPDDEIAELREEENVQISSVIANQILQAKSAKPGLVGLGIELTLSLLSAAWW